MEANWFNFDKEEDYAVAEKITCSLNEFFTYKSIEDLKLDINVLMMPYYGVYLLDGRLLIDTNKFKKQIEDTADIIKLASNFFRRLDDEFVLILRDNSKFDCLIEVFLDHESELLERLSKLSESSANVIDVGKKTASAISIASTCREIWLRRIGRAAPTHLNPASQFGQFLQDMLDHNELGDARSAMNAWRKVHSSRA